VADFFKNLIRHYAWVGFKTETVIWGKTESSVLTGVQVGFEAALAGPKVRTV